MLAHPCPHAAADLQPDGRASPRQDHRPSGWFCFFFNDTATTEIYTLSLHDALPICWWQVRIGQNFARWMTMEVPLKPAVEAAIKSRRTTDRKSTRLNSSHRCIS